MAFDSAVLPPELLLRVNGYAVYRCYSEQGDLLYVGSTGQLGRRFGAHMEKAWFLQVRGITLEWYRDEVDALNAERLAIHVEHPKYNIVHRTNAGALPRPKPRTQQRKRSSQGAKRGASVPAKNAKRSAGAIRARRHRLHKSGDHSECLTGNCPDAPVTSLAEFEPEPVGAVSSNGHGKVEA